MSKPRNYLFTSGAPTPNGRLHVGHIGAQFLKLDVLKRHVRRAGDGATLLFSVDAFDTPIYLAARRQGVTEEEVCRRNIDGITRDLEYAAIDYDVFLDTSVGAGRDLIRQTAVELDDLVAARKVAVEEKVPYSRRTGEPVTGRLLTGECPSCARTMHGYVCDPCGLQLSPDQIRNARAADPTDSLDWRAVTNHFVRIDTRELLDYVGSLPLPAVTRRKADAIASMLLTDEHFLVRWTASEPWGIGTGVPGQVYFNRLLVTLAEQIPFGEITKEKLGLRHNPFDRDSGVVTVLAYGVDNLGGRLIENTALALATDRYRPFDHHLVSEFYRNDGEKMATSGSNALWVADVADLTGFSRDGLRAYMASIATPDVEVDVSLPDLTRFMRSVTGRLGRVVALALSAAVGAGTRIGPEVLAVAERGLDRQSTALDLTHVDLPAAWRTTEEWIHRALSSSAEDRYATLACFAVIASPIAPDAAGTVWRLLGREGAPDRTSLRRLATGGV